MQPKYVFMIVQRNTPANYWSFRLIIVSYTVTSKGRIIPFGVNDHPMVLKCQNSHIMVQIFLVLGLDSRK